MDITTKISNNKQYLNIHAIVNDTYVNGPGKRIAIWFQGCSFQCDECFNPELWNFRNANIIRIDELTKQIIEYDGDGVTFSGGEPMLQAYGFLELLRKIELRNFTKGIMCFTGCEVEEIEETPIIRSCFDYIDLAIIGRFVKYKKQFINIAGSHNQQFVFLDKKGRGKEKISESEVEIDQKVEIHLGEKNTMQLTGFPNIDKEKLKEMGIAIIG